MDKRDELIAKLEELIDNLKIMSNNYQVLNGQYIISKNVLDVFIENYESEIASLKAEIEKETETISDEEIEKTFPLIDINNCTAIERVNIGIINSSRESKQLGAKWMRDRLINQ
jgi:hypothetical protein